MVVPGKCVIGGIAAGAALAYYVRRRRARTGESCPTILKNLPGDTRRWVGGVRRRAVAALEEGKTAARDRDAELDGQLASAGAPPAHGD